jgi:hypothetical protein
MHPWRNRRKTDPLNLISYLFFCHRDRTANNRVEHITQSIEASLGIEMVFNKTQSMGRYASFILSREGMGTPLPLRVERLLVPLYGIHAGRLRVPMGVIATIVKWAERLFPPIVVRGDPLLVRSTDTRGWIQESNHWKSMLSATI